MHYYSHNIGDYRRDTGHLTMLEHGAYRQLLDSYYLSEKPLTLNHADLMRTHCARTADEVQAIENVLKDFFVATAEGYIHKRCDVEIEAFHAKSTSASESAKARWARVRAEKQANAMRTHSEGNANQEPITINHKPEDKSSCGVSDHKAVKDDSFESAWKLYPKREGSNPKNKAHSAWKARLKDGVSVDDMVQGLARYVAYCKARGSVGTEYVMQAQRFFGPAREFENEWKAAPAVQAASRHHGFDQRDYFEGLTQREDGTYAI